MKRTDGHYWVMSEKGAWFIAQYFEETDDWYVCGYGESFEDTDWTDIDEDKIKR